MYTFITELTTVWTSTAQMTSNTKHMEKSPIFTIKIHSQSSNLLVLPKTFLFKLISIHPLSSSTFLHEEPVTVGIPCGANHSAYRRNLALDDFWIASSL